MHYSRLLGCRLLELSRVTPVLVLTGARQSGKTTLLRSLFPGHRYVSLDLPSVAEQAERSPDSFLAANPPPLLVDEVQYAPKLFRYLKIRVDEARDAMGQFVLTGSQSFPLMRGVADSLAGRCIWKELENLSLREIQSGKELNTAPADWAYLVTRGLFPELWKNADLPGGEFFSTYVATYLERDVRQIVNVGNLRDFERFLRLLALRSGSLLNKSDLARDTGVSIKAVGDWLSVLETSGQVSFLEPWFENLGKRIVKTPKVVVRDPGLLCFLLGIDAEVLGNSPLKGHIWETFVVSEIRKLSRSAKKQATLWFYRDQGGREVDLLVEHHGVLDLVEIKWCENPDDGDTLALRSVMKAFETHGSSVPPGKSFIICRTPVPYTRHDGVRVLSPLDLQEIFRDD